jgi:hypothetical protein
VEDTKDGPPLVTGEGIEIPLRSKTYGGAIGLPAEEEESGVIYVVSMLVAEWAEKTERQDCVYPDTGPNGVVRDEKGTILGCRALLRPMKYPLSR